MIMESNGTSTLGPIVVAQYMHRRLVGSRGVQKIDTRLLQGTDSPDHAFLNDMWVPMFEFVFLFILPRGIFCLAPALGS